jgi:hypothetical protein
MSTKISQLPVATSPVAPDVVLPVVQDGLTKKASIDQLGFLQSGTGATTRTIQNKLRDVVSVKDFGAVGDGVANDTAAFTAAGSSASVVGVLIPSGTYNLSTNPTPTGNVTWIVQKGASFTGAGTLSFLTNKIVSQGAFRSIESNPSFYSGIFGYLEQNAAQSGYGVIGLHGAAQTAGGTGASNEADIGLAGFVANNLVGGGSGAWALYGTAIHESGVLGTTHGMELDIANIGSTVALFPSAMFPASNTNALWLGSGGEVTATPGAAKTASCAIGIISNDPAGVANFEKGIVFHNKSIAGADGASGNGIAVAFASGHQVNWFNNSGQAVGEIVCNAKLLVSAVRQDFSDFGVLFGDRGTGATLLQISTVASAANYFTFTAGAVPELAINGSGTNVDFYLNPKGTGTLKFGTFTSNADAPVTGYITIKDAAGNIRKLATIA